jgi:large subunit ribosomal protein L25
MDKTIFQVNKRQAVKNNQLRRTGIIPANVYGVGKESVSLQCPALAFEKLYRTLSDNAIVYLQVEGDKQELPVLVDEVQFDVYGKNLLHVVFRQINLKQKIKAEVPVLLVGEFDLKDALALLNKDFVEVEALPADLPEHFEIDQSQFKAVGDQFTLADLNFDQSKIELVLDEDVEPAEVVLASVQEKQAEEEVEDSGEIVEPEVVGEKKEDTEAGEGEEAK